MWILDNILLRLSHLVFYKNLQLPTFLKVNLNLLVYFFFYFMLILIPTVEIFLFKFRKVFNPFILTIVLYFRIIIYVSSFIPFKVEFFINCFLFLISFYLLGQLGLYSIFILKIKVLSVIPLIILNPKQFVAILFLLLIILISSKTLQ